MSAPSLGKPFDSYGFYLNGPPASFKNRPTDRCLRPPRRNNAPTIHTAVCAFRFELLGREHHRHEGQQPEQRVVADFFQEVFHGIV